MEHQPPLGWQHVKTFHSGQYWKELGKNLATDLKEPKGQTLNYLTMEKEELIRKHLEAINNIVGIKDFKPEDAAHLWRVFRRMEKAAQRLAELRVNSAEYCAKGTWEADREAMEQKIKSYFVHPENVFYNTDPRGCALKISGLYGPVPFAFTDLGGNIQIAPDELG